MREAHEQGKTVHYGRSTPYKGKEGVFQSSAMRLIRLQYDRFAYHCPNGGSRNKIEAAKLKREGVLAGVSDILIDLPVEPFYGARIELKVKGGKLSDTQKEYLATVAKRGYFTAVCWSMDGLIHALKVYFKK